jgi:hypothetical protein
VAPKRATGQSKDDGIALANQLEYEVQDVILELEDCVSGLALYYRVSK